MTPEIMTPVEALETILRAIYPENPNLCYAIRLHGCDWFHHPSWYEGSQRDHRRARIAAYLIRRNLRYGRIRTHGILQASELNTDVAILDVRKGDLDFFEATLDCCPGRIYRNVFFCAADILQLVTRLASAGARNTFIPLSR
jgi:hypothetical protein